MQVQEAITAAQRQASLFLILDNLPAEATETKVKGALKSKKLKFAEVQVYNQQNSIRYGPTGVLSCMVRFITKQDLVQAASEIVNRSGIRVGRNVL